MKLLACLLIWAYIDSSNGVSTKMDFGEEEPRFLVTNANKTEDEDVEVKHTIVVSTKVKNNNRRGIHGNDGDSGTVTFRVEQSSQKKVEPDDSGEVPVVGGYKAIETTRIKTPDSRHKAKIYPDSIFVSRNIRDDYDNVYPNVAANPMQWKPSNFYNNVNWWNQDNGKDSYNTPRKPNPYNNAGKLQRKMTDDGAREFYCKKCLEYSNAQGLRGCSSTFLQQRSANPVQYETTTKMKIDGKLAKLN